MTSALIKNQLNLGAPSQAYKLKWNC